MWEMLAAGAGPHLTFVRDAFWSANWDEERRAAQRKAAIARLEAGEFDFVLAMGTWAGQDLATDEHSVPVLVMSASDPVRAGIIESADDPGLDHVHATCDPDRYLRQIRAFHNIVGFSRLGVVYEDSAEGRVWASLDELEAESEARGFTIEKIAVPDAGIPEEEASRRCREALAALAPRIDAFWIGAHNGLGHRFMPGVLDPLMAAKVPVWTSGGERSVRRGALMSIAEADIHDIGLFYAKVAGAIFRGARPCDVGQVFEDPKALLLNLETARRIGFTVPRGLLVAADRTWDRIEGEDDSGGEGNR
jgi:ABC-type uncharacterized transport system substrate-binding protein